MEQALEVLQIDRRENKSQADQVKDHERVIARVKDQILGEEGDELKPPVKKETKRKKHFAFSETELVANPPKDNNI